MRELKFRAFDTENKTWTFVTLGDLICGACTEKGDKPLSGAKQAWEQYTGLKDRNGKEIYEGDILRVFFECEMSITYYKVIYDEQRAGFVAKSLSGKDDHFAGYFARYLVNHCEVFGNIHENPELLENKQ